MRRALLTIVSFLAVAAPARGQEITRPWTEWRTIETPHFRVHYPADLAAWTEPTAARLEAVHEAVTAFVGYAPDDPVTVIVDDPRSIPNGFDWPGSAIVMWPTPPEPGTMFERYRGWGEILSVHELTHEVHLSRPTRNPRERFLYRLLPIPLQPIVTRTPRWAIEGYATLVEGELTGGGRPHGVWRPTVLRQWALEGRLPTYGRLNGTEGFLEGEMAYLVGSAYLQWLVERSGDESLPQLWRRLTARRVRSFDEAFAGVFGGPPDELYGRFVVETTGKALEARARIEEAGLAEGELFQRLEGWTGDPAVSPDGALLAVTRQPETGVPAEIVVWSTAPDTLTTEERQAEARALARAPQDVAGIEWRPRPQRVLARLAPADGRGHFAPRWLPGGDEILVIHSESAGDGVLRPDVFVWRWKEGAVRRVTRGAGVRQADPEPGRATAVGTRCLRGACDLVRVDLMSGDLTVLAAGEPDGVTYAGARSGPDRSILASVRRGGRWEIDLFDSGGRFLRRVDPEDGAVRSGAAFLTDGTVVVASDASGVLELERIDPASGAAWALTGTAGAFTSPAPDPAGTDLYFLSLTTHGWDLRRVDGDSVGPPTALGPDLAPVAPVPPVPGPVFAPTPLSPAPYGLGPRDWTWLPLGTWAPEGWNAGLTVYGSDPVGRLGWTASGALGGESAWRGGAALARWRGWRPETVVGGFWARQRPSEQSLDGAPPLSGLDHETAGGLAEVAFRRDFVSRVSTVRVGGSAARHERPGMGEAARTMAWVGWEEALLQRRGRWRFTESFRLHATGGETGGEGWRRGLASGRVAGGPRGSELAVEALFGATDAGPQGFEAFAFGGAPSPLLPPELLSQRLPLPAVPVGYATGTRAASLRIAWVSGGTGIYHQWVRAGAPGQKWRWKRVTGIESEVRTPALSYLGLPAIGMVIGFARSLDEPFEDDNRFYLAVRYEP